MAKNYIDNKKFEQLVKNYLEDKPKYETELVTMLELLITNILNSFHFEGVDKEDARQECFLLILKILKNFNPERGSAFDYFTTVIMNNLKLMYTKNKKYNKKMAQYIETLNKDLLES